MATVVEEIPEALQHEVDAALSWLNRERCRAFEVVGQPRRTREAIE